jgi:hypothetical protein
VILRPKVMYEPLAMEFGSRYERVPIAVQQIRVFLPIVLDTVQFSLALRQYCTVNCTERQNA